MVEALLDGWFCCFLGLVVHLKGVRMMHVVGVVLQSLPDGLLRLVRRPRPRPLDTVQRFPQPFPVKLLFLLQLFPHPLQFLLVLTSKLGLLSRLQLQDHVSQVLGGLVLPELCQMLLADGHVEHPSAHSKPWAGHALDPVLQI